MWARAERFTTGQIVLATGLSEATVGRIITDARRDTAYFRQCGFVMEIRAGMKGTAKRYLCRFCGWLIPGNWRLTSAPGTTSSPRDLSTILGTLGSATWTDAFP